LRFLALLDIFVELVTVIVLPFCQPNNSSLTALKWIKRHYSVLEEVGEDCLYMDTDSVIFVDRDRAHVNRLPIGNYLGGLTNEIPVKDIVLPFCQPNNSSLTALKWIKRLLAKLKVKPRTLQISLPFPVLNE
jgi:hypothetical protein